MTGDELLMDDMENIICLGSMNAKPEDRHLQRSEVKPLQYFQGGAFRAFEPLSGYGEHGLGGLVEMGRSVYFTTGWDLWEAGADEGFIPRQIGIEGLRQVHEISVIDEMLWLANTGSNELVCYDPKAGAVVERLCLPRKDGGDPGEIINTYHCNQAFAGDGGELLALVHHVDGRQHMMGMASKVMTKLKKQGNGGVINARTGEVLISNLSGPHSVRKLRDGSWLVCDSCRSLIANYDPEWKLIRTADSKGWSRGVAVGERYIYVGVSATRRRYLSLMPSTAKVPNMVLVYDPQTWRLAHEIVMHDIEQVTDVCMAGPLMRRWLGL